MLFISQTAWTQEHHSDCERLTALVNEYIFIIGQETADPNLAVCTPRLICSTAPGGLDVGNIYSEEDFRLIVLDLRKATAAVPSPSEVMKKLATDLFATTNYGKVATLEVCR